MSRTFHGTMTKTLSGLTLLVVARFALGAQAAAKDTSVRLERVNVTATRSSQSTFLVPLAVTSVTDDELHRSSGVGLDQALKFVPGVLAQSWSGMCPARTRRLSLAGVDGSSAVRTARFGASTPGPRPSR